METVFNAWHPSWRDLPWKAWTSPVERFEVLPSFVIGEFFFIIAAILLLIHAAQHGRVYLMLWISSLITGTANDAFFMVLPIVDNFWQSQACIMLTPRMPLYIPCVYVVFMYCSLVGSWRFKLSSWAQAALAGLMGEMIYSPYDITGAKFLWWTWHDTDAPIHDRLFGAPIGSSAWVITFSCSFQLIWRWILSEDQILDKNSEEQNDSSSSLETLSLSSAIVKLFISATLTTPLMMLQMAFFQLISGDSQGWPTIRTMMACIVIYLIVIYAWPIKKSKKNVLYQTNTDADAIIRNLLTIHFIFFVANMFISIPENHMSTGVHQIVGDCKIYDTDLAGHQRQVYLCQEKFDEDFNLECPNFRNFKTQKLSDGTEWYTVCGNSHQDKNQFLVAVLLLAIMGIFQYRTAFSSRSEKPKFE